jgi:hypothetical protein
VGPGEDQMFFFVWNGIGLLVYGLRRLLKPANA